ncbi:MAG: hypothetical protein ABIN55_05005 [Aeromicrobium sp.]
MTVILAFLAAAAFLAMLALLVHAVATDGYGTRPPPRSHQEEVGSWITQQFTR